MLYPIRPYLEIALDYPNDNHEDAFPLNRLEYFWTRSLALPPGTFRQRFGIINRLLDEYRLRAYHVGWAFFSQQGDLTKPDETQTSDIFEIKPEDFKVAVGVTYHDHTRHRAYPNEVNILSTIPDSDELVVGGFHEKDCVRRFRDAAERLGIRSTVDSCLTDQVFHRISLTFEQDLFADLIARGKLDPTMHEDDPQEMTNLLLGDRLAKYLVQI